MVVFIARSGRHRKESIDRETFFEPEIIYEKVEQHIYQAQ